jgi:hypothetical protein
MYSVIYDLVVFVYSILAHEGTHYILFKYGGHKPQVRLSSIKVGLNTYPYYGIKSNDEDDVTQRSINLLCAFFIGLIVSLLGGPFSQILYAMACSNDLHLIFQYQKMIAEKAVSPAAKVKTLELYVEGKPYRPPQQKPD